MASRRAEQGCATEIVGEKFRELMAMPSEKGLDSM